MNTWLMLCVKTANALCANNSLGTWQMLMYEKICVVPISAPDKNGRKG